VQPRIACREGCDKEPQGDASGLGQIIADDLSKLKGIVGNDSGEIIGKDLLGHYEMYVVNKI
jgi:hypothetical protein